MQQSPRRSTRGPSPAVGATVVGLLLTACAPMPPSKTIQVPVRQFSVGQVNLPSGLKVIVEDDPSARVVASVLVVAAGSAADPRGQEGLAHLVEHLTFRAHRSGQPALSTRLALNGIGSWNAITSKDTTTYYQVGPLETLPRMIEVEVARMLDPLQGVEADYFDGERGVVLNELKWRDESGVHQEIFRQLYAQLFPADHPYAHGPGGTAETVSRLTLEQARAWAQARYQPQNMTWVIAGALDRAKTAALLEQAIPVELREGTPANPTIARKSTALGQLPPTPAKIPAVVAPVTRQELLVAWVLPPSTERMEPVYEALPPFVEARTHSIRGIEGVDANLQRFEDASVLVMTLRLEEGRDPEEIVKKLREDWQYFWREGTLTGMAWAEQQLGPIRAATIVGLARYNESLLNRTFERARRAHLSGSATTLSARSKAIGALTFKDVLAAGRVSITGEDLRAIVLQPASGTAREEDAPSPNVPPAFAPEQVRAEYPANVVAAFVRGPHLSAATRFVASNGLEVNVVPDGHSGLVTVTLGVPAGRRTSTPIGLADRLRWSRQSRDYGTPASIGASERGTWTDDSGFLEYRASAGNLPNLLAMLSERVLGLHTVDPPKWAHDPAPERESRTFDRLFWTAVEGDSAAPPRAANEVAQLDGGATDRWWKAIMDPRRAVLVVAGDIQGSVQEEVEHWLSRWHSPSEARAFELPPPPVAPGQLRVVRTPLPRGKQVRVRLACSVQTTTLEQELAARMLGLEVERRWNGLERETLGSSYGFHASTSPHRAGTVQILVTGRVDNGSARRMAVAVSQAWKALPDVGGDDNRLNRLRWELGRGYNVRFLTSQQVAQAVAEERLRGRTSAALDEVPQALMRVSQADLAEVGKQCQRSAVLGLMGDPAVLDVDALLPPDRIAVKP